MHLRMKAVPAAEILLVKLERAQGGCLGTKADEKRGKLRKASGVGKQSLVRGARDGGNYLR